MGLGVCTHFRFKIGGVRERGGEASGWTRQALQSAKFTFGFRILKITSKSPFGISALPGTCGYSAQQIVSSSLGNNGEMSANEEKNQIDNFWSILLLKVLLLLPKSIFPQATDSGHRHYLFYYLLGFLWG